MRDVLVDDRLSWRVMAYIGGSTIAQKFQSSHWDSCTRRTAIIKVVYHFFLETADKLTSISTKDTVKILINVLV